MQTPAYRFPPVVRGTDAAIVLLAKIRDLFTGEVFYLDLDGARAVLSVGEGAAATTWDSAAPGGRLTLTPATARIDLPLRPADTSALPLGDLPFLALLTLRGGRVLRLLSGTLPVVAR